MKKILWVDDEIELLKPHLILLEQRGHTVETATNGEDAIERNLRQSDDDVDPGKGRRGWGGIVAMVVSCSL